MAAAEEGQRPIIIKKKKGHAEAHGGAWKVAFADFMTAMFALFLVLWILTQSQEVKSAVASYFRHPMDFEGKPESKFQGNDGLMQNLQGRMDTHSTILSTRSSQSPPEEGTPPTTLSGSISKTAADLAAVERKVDQEKTKDTDTVEMDEVRTFVQIADKLWKELGMDARYQSFKDNLMIQTLEDGLLIQIVNQRNSPLMEPGKAEFCDKVKALLHDISEALAAYPKNKLEIDGHCASLLPLYDVDKKWLASSYLADLTRHELLNAGKEKCLKADQISKLSGCADSRPLIVPAADLGEMDRQYQSSINFRVTIFMRPRQWQPERY